MADARFPPESACSPAPLRELPVPESGISEFRMIERYFAPMAAPGGLGLLDDAALMHPPPGHDLVVTVDALVSGIHFFADDPPAMVAKKALRTNLSDLAAKGAEPLGFLLTFGRGVQQDEAWIAAFAAGLAEDAARYHCPLYGGDTVRARKNHADDGFFLSITAMGTVPRGTMVPRQGGKAGDHLYVTGTIGDAALGLALRLQPQAPWAAALPPEGRAHLLDRYLLPRPRLELAEALRRYARAAMDISDGLVGDAEKLNHHLGRAVEIAHLPLSPAARMAIHHAPAMLETVLTGGDDYEILAAIPPEDGLSFENAAHSAGVPVTRIGRLTPPGTPNLWRGEGGSPMAFTRRSYTHF